MLYLVTGLSILGAAALICVCAPRRARHTNGRTTRPSLQGWYAAAIVGLTAAGIFIATKGVMELGSA